MNEQFDGYLDKLGFGSSNYESARNSMLAPDLKDAEKQALIDGYVQDQVKRN
ncbi:hypothetical protein [Paenibacillus harenae]|uniref:Uncharacterized protein n=1 Tax=Paenibacillus harenae TaxID=306543 RepID=A0ABT9UAX3_PAEHA|nr:hypothetical protein [Paenibacillus harenae]MDQ0064077.1 hypothetical protein [Paenibacillus harenae]MDQ0116807.1 hypothetical protein [Paenibacillus harenae]